MPVTNYCSSRSARHTPFFRGHGLAVIVGIGCALGSSAAWPQDELPADFSEGFYGFSDAVPEVLTTTRLRQPKVRVPGTTTVIEGDMIRDLGIMSLVEIFRLVPGMVVAEVGSSTPVTTYHGTVHYEQRRMQVLVDGRTAHRATLSDMDWQTMPVPIELIERVEVARGPNSAAYGINAFLGTINIITRDPADTAGVEARVVRGSRQYIRTFGSVGDAGGNYDWRLAYEKRKFEGFDYQIDRVPEYTGDYQDVPFHDGHDINVFNYDSRLKLGSDVNLELRTGVVDGTNEEDRRKNGELFAAANPDIDVRDYYLQAKLNVSSSESHFFHIQASYENFDRRQRWPISVPESVMDCLGQGLSIYDGDNEEKCFALDENGNLDFGDNPLSARVNADSEDSRLEFELQDTLIFNPDLKLVSGLGYRVDTYRSETYFNGRGKIYQSRAFANLEYTPINWLTLNTGGNYERTTTTHEGYFSPRVAANFTLNDNHALRLVYSRAVRTPDAFEQYPDYGFTLRDVEPELYADYEGYRVESVDIWEHPELVTLGEELEEERITSREISYFGQFPIDQGSFQLEVRAFKDKLRDMISGVIQFDDWTLDNNVALDQKGFEVEAALQYPKTTLRATYGYLDQDGWYTGPADYDEEEKTYNVELLGRLSVRHSGSLAAIRELPLGFTLSGAMYWADELRASEFQRLDMRLAKSFYRSDFTGELALTMQHYIDEEPDLSSDNNIEDQNQFFVEAGIRF